MASNLPAVTTTGIPERYGSVEYRELRGKYSNALGSEAGLDVLRIMPSDEERKILTERAREVQAMVRPISYAGEMQKRAAAALSRMFQSFRNLGVKDADTAEKMTASYVSALVDIPQFAIEESCEAFRLGKLTKYYFGEGSWGEHDPAFCPSESVLALVARAKAKFFEDELASLKKILGAKKATPLLANDRTPEEQARINKQVEDAKAQLAAASAARELMEATARADALARAKEANERIILAEYRSLGLKPMRGKTGVLISPSLLKTMGHVVMKSDDQFHAEHDSEARLP